MSLIAPKPISKRRASKKERIEKAILLPHLVQREINNRSLFEFMQFFWSEITQDEFKPNWHIPYLCEELEKIAYNVANNIPKKYDLIINIPPGTTKTITCSIMFPVWCWTKWFRLKFITASYNSTLALETAELSRDLVRSDKFKLLYPELDIKQDKDTKSNFKIVKKDWWLGFKKQPRILQGGNRFSTSVGAGVTGFHGHILIWDDPLNPLQAISEAERETANKWVDETASTRKADKEVTTTIVVMQRLHQKDVTGHLLSKGKKNIKHICLPGEIFDYKHLVKPAELLDKYKDGLLDPIRLSKDVLQEMRLDLGQYGYAGQVGQDPTPPKGGMFKIENIQVLDYYNRYNEVLKEIRYWDKAGTKAHFEGKPGGAYTVGVKIAKTNDGKYIIVDVKRGQWEAAERERIILATAFADGRNVKIYHEQEPGSGGKESAQATSTMLANAGFVSYADLPQGDKIYRADPFSAKVNIGDICIMRADWNHEYLEELRFFPFSTYKDQVDASSAGYNILMGKKTVSVH